MQSLPSAVVLGLLGMALLPLPYANGAAPAPVAGKFEVVVGTAANGCAEDLDRLARKVEENYAGFVLELQGSARTEYDARLSRSRREAASAQGSECFLVLRDFVRTFEDPHLFIFQSTRMDSTETTRLARSVENRPVDEREVRKYLESRSELLDPVEGIWFDRGLRVAVLADSAATGTFVAIVLSPDSSTWKRGDVRARLTRAPDGGYDAEVRERNHATRQLAGHIHGGRLLRLAPLVWGREYPVSPAESGALDAFDPRRPTLRSRGATVVVSMPSHDPKYKPVLDSLVARHRQTLERAERLIIDLRGNEGGSSATSDALLPYIVSDSQLPSPLHSGDPMMLSSQDQIAYATRFFAGPAGADSSPRLQRLLSRMRSSPGKLVPLLDPGESVPQPPDVLPVHGPRSVALITDGGTVSAAEVLVATAMRSTRVTVFGEPTEGALDYQNVYIVPFQDEGGRLFLGYPTITAHTDLPSRGIRGRGIAPHVALDLDTLQDVTGHVDRLLQLDSSNPANDTNSRSR